MSRTYEHTGNGRIRVLIDNFEKSKNQTVNTIGVDTSSTSRTITLSSSDKRDRKIFFIHDQSGNANINRIRIETEGNGTISGANSGGDKKFVEITEAYESVTLRSNGKEWYIV